MEAMDIYRVHVSLREIGPAIWRRIELSSQTTLKQLHRILQIAMGWEDSHLHEYIVNGQRYGTADPAYDGPGEILREAGVRLATVLPEPGAEVLYVYDFGDCWQHDVRLEAVFPAESGIEYPRILDGARSCPPEDCGGAGGYADLLEVLLDPTHEEFEHMREWVGPRFNAEVFSVDAQMNVCRKIDLSP
jgi:Plasmid pRiA4b ORF-3-like protein